MHHQSKAVKYLENALLCESDLYCSCKVLSQHI